MFKKFIKIINAHYWGQKTFFAMLSNLKRLKHLDPFTFITLTVKKLRPPLKVISRVIAGKKVYNTEYIPPQNSIHFAFRWLIDAAKTRDYKNTLGNKLCLELIDAFNKKGLAYKTKLEYNTTLQENYRRAKTETKILSKRRKKNPFVAKVFYNNLRLKANGFKKLEYKKQTKTKFSAIKKTLSPLFRKPIIINYLAKKQKKYQNKTRVNQNKTVANARFRQFRQSQKKPNYVHAKKYLYTIVKKNITVKILAKQLINRRRKQTQIKFNKLQAYAEKRYLNLLRKQKKKTPKN